MYLVKDITLSNLNANILSQDMQLIDCICIQWSLYYTTLYFKTTLIKRPPTLASSANYVHVYSVDPCKLHTANEQNPKALATVGKSKLVLLATCFSICPCG